MLSVLQQTGAAPLNLAASVDFASWNRSSAAPDSRTPLETFSLHRAEPNNLQRPTEIQKLVFTIATISKALREYPNIKTLLVLKSNTVAKEYKRHLQQRCNGLLRALLTLDQQLWSCKREMDVPNPNMIITTISSLAKAVTSNQVQLEGFDMMLLDHPFSEDELYPDVQLIVLQWGLLPERQRPVFMDLFSLGNRPPPSIKVPPEFSCKEVPSAAAPAPKCPSRTEEEESVGELSEDLKQDSAADVAQTNQLPLFLEYLRSLDWSLGITMGIFVQDSGFGALLVYIINEQLGSPIAREISSRSALDQECQIAVLPSHVNVDVSRCDIVVSIDRASNITVARNPRTTESADHYVPETENQKITEGDVSPEDCMAYPYEHASGYEVSISTCLPIFLSYCWAVLRESGSAGEDQFFQYSWDKAHRIDVLCSVTYPSPKGPVKITNKQVHAAWAGRTVLDVISPGECEKLGRSSIQQRWFVYVAVIDMISCGYLDEHNNPTPLAMCESTLSTWNATKSSQSAAPKLPLVASPSGTVVPAAIGRPQPLHSSSPQMDAWLPNKDPKSLLNELQHKIPNLVLVYDTVKVSGKSQLASFQSTVHVQCDDCMLKFQGEPSNAKKNAEKSAALAALDHITNVGLPEFQSLVANHNSKSAAEQAPAAALADVQEPLAANSPHCELDPVIAATSTQLNGRLQWMSPASSPAHTSWPMNDLSQTSEQATWRPQSDQVFSGDLALGKKDAGDSAATLKALQSLAAMPVIGWDPL